MGDKRVDHSTPGFTLHVYSHVLPGMQEEASRALEARLLNGAAEGRAGSEGLLEAHLDH